MKLPIKIEVIHQNENKNSDELSKQRRRESWAKIISAIAIPVILGVGGWILNSTINERNISRDYVQIAVGVLSDTTTRTQSSLRAWAVEILSEYSPVPLGRELEAEIRSGDVLLPTSNFSEAFLKADRRVRNQVSYELSSSDGQVVIQAFGSGLISTNSVLNPRLSDEPL